MKLNANNGKIQKMNLVSLEDVSLEQFLSELGCWFVSVNITQPNNGKQCNIQRLVV